MTPKYDLGYICCVSYILITSVQVICAFSVNEKEFRHVGYVVNVRRTKQIDEMTITPSESRTIYCATNCVKTTQCNAFQICSQSNILVCKLWEGKIRKNDFKKNAVGNYCDHFQMDDGCHIGYLNRTSESCVYGCEDYNHDGVYPITIGDSITLSIWCEIRTNYSWMVIQRRKDGSVDFIRDWNAYENGFGNLSSEFWLGNSNIHRLTSNGYTYLRVELEDHEGNKTAAEYSHFSVSGPDDDYRLSVSGFDASGALVPGDSLTESNGQRFTTIGRDNDNNPNVNCAAYYKGGMWHNNCHWFNPNGQYGNDAEGEGINWGTWKGWKYSLKSVQMMIRKP